MREAANKVRVEEQGRKKNWRWGRRGNERLLVVSFSMPLGAVWKSWGLDWICSTCGGCGDEAGQAAFASAGNNCLGRYFVSDPWCLPWSPLYTELEASGFSLRVLSRHNSCSSR